MQDHQQEDAPPNAAYRTRYADPQVPPRVETVPDGGQARAREQQGQDAADAEREVKYLETGLSGLQEQNPSLIHREAEAHHRKDDPKTPGNQQEFYDAEL